MIFSCSDRASDQGRLAGIAARLAAPARVVTLDQALADFLVTDIVVDVDAPRLFEEAPELPDRLRGAWGRALETMAHNENPAFSAAGSPSAYAVFFGPPIGIGDNEPVRPYVIRADRAGMAMRITLRLFGFADCWLADAMAALEAAIAGGIALRQSSHHRVFMHLRDIWVERSWGIAVRPLPKRAVMLLETPLALRSGRYIGGNRDRLGPAIARRLRALCLWQDMALAPGAEWRSLAAAAGGWRVLKQDIEVTDYRRFSVSQRQGQTIRGLVGRAVVEAFTETSWSLLEAAAIIHGGSGSAGGLGRILIVPL